MFKRLTPLRFLTVLASIVTSLTATVAYANQYYIGPVARTAIATSTQSFMTPGTATTTLTLDSYNVNSNNSSLTNYSAAFLADRATLAVQFAASSTSAVLNMNVEYSQDNVDWYANDLGQLDGFTASTTSASNGSLSVTNPQTFSWTFASSTVGGSLASVATAPSNKVISIPIVMRYVRVVFTMGTGTTTPAGNGSVWAALYPKSQFPTK